MYHGGENSRKPNPKEDAGFLSLITFFFTSKLLRKGFRKDVTEDDVYEVLPDFKSSVVGENLEKHWKKEKNEKKPSLYRLLWRCYGKYYLLLGIAQLAMKIIMIMILPKTKGKLVSYFTPSSKLSKSDAVYYAIVYIGLNMLICIYNHNYRFLITELGIKIKTALCSLIYKKSLKLTTNSLLTNGIGKIATIFAKDVISFEYVIIFINDMWISVIVFLVASYLMYSKIGAAALAGISVLFIVMPLQVYLGKLTAEFRLKAAKATDDRLQISKESLSGIKLIKMYTWEDYFCEKILKARREEMRRIKQYYLARTAFIETGTFIMTLTWYILVTTYVGIGNTLTAEVAFFLAECLKALRSPITISIPIGILRCGEVAASSHRILKVLKAPEQTEVTRLETKSKEIELRSVTTELNATVIHNNISLSFEPGVNLVSGKFGSGKSSLLKVILQDYPVSKGQVRVEGTISYASQEPWLFPSSIKQNILFGQTFEEDRYQKVLDICGLNFDFETFKKGDETILDDQGRNLSKGQQVRVALARALYFNSDIYLLDDCLSNLDVRMQSSIFLAIKSFLKNKIVVMVSNNKQLFKKADKVYVMNNATIDSVTDDQPDFEFDDDGYIVKDFEASEATKPKYQNIYHEEPKRGRVGFSVYRKYFQLDGNIWVVVGNLLILGWILLLYFATQMGLGMSERSVSKWVNTQQSLSEYSINSTNTSKYLILLESDKQNLNVYTLAIIFSGVFLIMRMLSYFNYVANAATALYRSMVVSVLHATMKFFDLRYFGNILNRFSKDMYTIDEDLPFNIHEVTKCLFQLGSIIILILSVETQFSILVLLFFIVLVGIFLFYIPTGRSLKRLDSATRSPVIGHINATLEGLSTIRATHTQEILKTEFDRHQDLYTSTFYMLQSSARTFAFSMDMLCNIFSAAVVIRFLTAEKGTQAGFVGLAINQAFLLQGLLQWAVREWANVENHMTSVERVLEYTNEENEKKTGENVLNLGKIEFESVNLQYENSRELVLKHLTFTINPGEKIGIVGRTGAGKSSLISILFRLYQYQGTISINGVDIKTISLDFLRSSIAIITQDPIIFSGTVRDNIDPLGQYTDQELWETINTVNLKEIIPNLDFQVTENDSRFSAGQKQLICLVRALVSKKKILILDEATANVDVETDAVICQILKNHFVDCTVIVVAHKVDYVMNSDRVMVIDKGEIVEFDSPGVLLEMENGYFQRVMKQVKPKKDDKKNA